MLAAAATWAEQHPPESIHHAATWITAGGDTGLLLAGPGAPLVAEFCIAELALAVGLSTDAGRTLIAHAVELKHRLPKVWARVMTGDLQAWRARRVAEHTLLLSPEAVGFVDAQVAGFAHKIGYTALERLVDRSHHPVHAREGNRRRHQGRRWSPRGFPPRPGLLQRHHPHRGRARPRRRPGPRRRPDPDSRAAPTLWVGEVAGRPPGHRRRRDRPPPARPAPHHRLGHRCRTGATPRAGQDRQGPSGGPARPPLRGRDHRHRGRPPPGPGGEHPHRGHRRPDQDVVRQHRHPDHRQTGDRPGRSHRHQRLRSPRPGSRNRPG